ncbi:MAG: serine/threonine-protein kinase [Methylotenera sp.]|nr:serine/threonine-protein kinase [Methylotenera sp.]
MSSQPYSLDVLTQQLTSLNGFEYVATGGQKTVYAANHQQHGRVALKLLIPSSSPERFDREIASVNAIGNGRVPQVYESGRLTEPYHDHLWLIEQWVDGVSLKDKLAQGPISNALILQIAFDMLAVLVEAEAHQIVHRDIKPDNILIAPDESICWLVDFGIARHLGRTSLTAGFMPHTLGYAPLEQLNCLKAEIDTRSDLFSLGVTLYECIEGVNPYTHGVTSADEVIHRMNTVICPEISRQVDNKDDLKDLITSMTRQKRIHRISTAAEAYEWMREIFDLGAV